MQWYFYHRNMTVNPEKKTFFEGWKRNKNFLRHTWREFIASRPALLLLLHTHTPDKNSGEHNTQQRK